MGGRIRVFIACSLDGFIAGDKDDLSWLPDPAESAPEDFGYNGFIDRVGAVLMGRRTYDAVQAFEEWPYGERPVFVATHRPLQSTVPTVWAVQGAIREIVDNARSTAGEKDVYLDGGDLIRQALDAGLVHDFTLTIVPVVLGRGYPLFAGAVHRHRLVLDAVREFDAGLVQLTYTSVDNAL